MFVEYTKYNGHHHRKGISVALRLALAWLLASEKSASFSSLFSLFIIVKYKQLIQKYFSPFIPTGNIDHSKHTRIVDGCVSTALRLQHDVAA
jgi:hypothetical protein